MDKVTKQKIAIRIELEKLIKSNPDLLELIKDISFQAIVYSHKLEKKKGIVHRKYVDNFIEFELDIVEEILENPY